MNAQDSSLSLIKPVLKGFEKNQRKCVQCFGANQYQGIIVNFIQCNNGSFGYVHEDGWFIKTLCMDGSVYVFIDKDRD